MMMSEPVWLARATALLFVGVTLAAGCTTANPPSGAARQVPGGQGVTDRSITVGGVLTKTSTTGYSTADAELGARARFARANAEGGVHGRLINFIGADDDGLDAARGMAAARKLVLRDKVLALVPVSSPTFNAGNFLDQQNVPWFGWAVGPAWCGHRTAFGFNGCLAPKVGSGSQTWWGRLVAAQIGGAGGRTAWIQGSDSTASKYGLRPIGQSFRAAGFRLVGASAALASTAPPADWNPYVQQIMHSDRGRPPDVVVSLTAGGAFSIGLYRALKRAGYTGVITDATSYDPKLLADPEAARALEGTYVAPMFEPFESQLPAVRQMKADIIKVVGSSSIQFTQHMAIGYWSADVFLQILQKTGRALSRESFLAAAASFSYHNPGFGQISYPADQSEPNGCGALVRLEAGAFAVARHLQCFDNVPLR